MWWMSFLNNHGDDATWKDQRDHRQRISIYCQEDKWRFVMMARRENVLIGVCYWNSHDYHLHDSDIALYKMKFYKDIRSKNKKPHWDAHIKGKQTETSFMKSYRTILNAHGAYVKQCTICTLGGVENWKYLTAWCKFIFTAKVWEPSMFRYK